MSYESFYKELVLSRFAELCEPHEWKYMEAAFDGDIDAAGMLTATLRNDLRGAVAVAMWRAKIKREAFREYFLGVWEHDHRYAIAAAQTRRTLGHMFRYAAFIPPPDVPERLTVWRGTSKLSMRDSLRGYSWTTDRDVACWFAMRFADTNGRPLVLRADIHRDDVALFYDGRGEREAVLLRPPKPYLVDGDSTDWATCHARHEAAIQAHNRALRAVN